ncbi:MAG: integrase core domain-containing protein, partial [Candidatus Ratteibacteria bacterium]
GYGSKRYIFSAIEKNTKFGFSRMYKNNSSYSGRDFLLRLYWLVNKEKFYIQTDNGSEFGKFFDYTCKELGIEHYYSREKNPKDHAEIERFNKTLQEEFLQLGNYTEDVDRFNYLLTEWLIEYNFRRPHQSLGYLTPIEFLCKKEKFDKNKNMCINKIDGNEKICKNIFNKKLLPMYPICTFI